MEYRWFYKKINGQDCSKHCVMSDAEAKADGWSLFNDYRDLTIGYETKHNEIEDIATEVDSLACPVCGKICGSKLGLTAHMRVHKNDQDK